MKKRFLLPIFTLLCFYSYTYSQARIGDPGRVFDPNQVVNVSGLGDFEAKRIRWSEAGVIGGIRTTGSALRQVMPLSDTDLNATPAIQAAIDLVAADGGGVVQLAEGIYTVRTTINMKIGVSLIGEASAGANATILKIEVGAERVIWFPELDQTNNQTAGLKNLKLEGTKGVPDPALMENVKTEYSAIVVEITRSNNCYMDNIVITNAGGSPVSTWSGGHHSFRDININGCWNKGGGGSCYFGMQSPDCLVYSSSFEGIRHFALQRQHCQYNVVYDNDINIDVNFHNADIGNNLIEANRIKLPAYLGDLSKAGGRRYVVMGPWSTSHAPTVSGVENYVYNNTVENFAFAGTPRCNENDKIYSGADVYEPETGANANPPLPSGNPFLKSTVIGSGNLIYATIDPALSIPKVENIEEISFSVFPTVLKSIDNLEVLISSNISKTSMQIIDLSGKVVLKTTLSSGNNSISINYLKTGIYIVSLDSEEKSLLQKIVLN